MKATLKHVANQYILIVDERPEFGKYYWTDVFGLENEIIINWIGCGDESFKIIAAENLGGVKGIKLELKDLLNNKYATAIGWDRYVKTFIDTEVEVTEHEEYWLVRL